MRRVAYGFGLVRWTLAGWNSNRLPGQGSPMYLCTKTVFNQGLAEGLGSASGSIPAPGARPL